MHIAFAIYGSLDAVSGGFIYDRSLVAALGALGHRVDVVTLPWRGYARALASDLVAPPPPWSPPFGCDVIVEDELIHPSLALRTSHRRGVRTIPGPGGARPPRVTLAHNLRADQPSERWPRWKALVERRYLQGVDGVIAVCENTLAGVRALGGAALPALVARPGRDHLAPDIDEAHVRSRSHLPGPLRILHAAAVVRHKGLRRLLAALDLSSGTDFQLDIVGDLTREPDHVAQLQTWVREHGMEARVCWHGEQRGAPLWELYRRSQVLALPSDREAYSLACLEALGFGLPVIATARGGLAEMFREGEAGVLLDPESVEEWAGALRELATDRSRLATRGVAALERYRAHDTWREVALSVKDFLLALTDR